MKATLVSLRPTETAIAVGRPSLTPELLAASGARYSRNNEGLEAILSKIDPANLDKSVDGLFRMIDYGHQSIADMAPVAMFLDGVSIWLAYLLWTWSPTAGGQESSTRYIKMSAADVYRPPSAGADWDARIDSAFDAYRTAYEFWDALGLREPERTRIPKALLDDPSEKARKQVDRMRRNYAFDRARYFLPVVAITNVMLVMSARAWVNLCQRLLASPLQEAKALGLLIRAELEFATPRLTKHASAKPSFESGFAAEQAKAAQCAKALCAELLGPGPTDAAPIAKLEVFPPERISGFSADLAFHDNRYAFIGSDLERTAVRFAWNAMAIAEVRDLNRHRTGTRFLSPAPVGFYWAEDQLLGAEPGPLDELKEIGRAASLSARQSCAKGDPDAPYHGLLGTQFAFEHTTTADKFIYEAELRTGTGAHYRYAKHLADCLELWYAFAPETKGLILEGSAEPE